MNLHNLTFFFFNDVPILMRDIICAFSVTECALSKITFLLELAFHVGEVELNAVVLSTIAGPIR